MGLLRTLRIGEGVREREDEAEGVGVMLPSSEPRADDEEEEEDSASDTSSGGASCTTRRDERVLMVEVAGGGSARRGGGFVGVGATTCFGARGGLLVSG